MEKYRITCYNIDKQKIERWLVLLFKQAGGDKLNEFLVYNRPYRHTSKDTLDIISLKLIEPTARYVADFIDLFLKIK